MGIKHLLHAIINWDTIRGIAGTAMAVILPLIKTLTPVFQFTGAVLGVVLVIYSIRHKRMEIKRLQNEQIGKANHKRANR